MIDYKHSANPHTIDGPMAAFPKIFSEKNQISSLLDVGCGIGTWIKAAMNHGISNVNGIDGVSISDEELIIPREYFVCLDLNKTINLGKKFDAVLCLEVAEHLEATSSESLIKTLTNHADLIIFSAAIPKQSGWHHVNCQWPDYWQNLFNKQGYTCEDNLRSVLWDDPNIEFWYKQNIFTARRSDNAGSEPRIKAIIHPEMQSVISISEPTFEEHIFQIENGRMPISWYITKPFQAIINKTLRKIRNI